MSVQEGRCYIRGCNLGILQFESYFLFTSNDVGLTKNLKLLKCFYSSVYIMAFTKMPFYAMQPFSWPSFHLLLKTIFTQQNIHTQCTAHLHISQGFCIPFFYVLLMLGSQNMYWQIGHTFSIPVAVSSTSIAENFAFT